MKKILFGTDWWWDCDDCTALRILARYMKKGEIELVGVAVNTCFEFSASSVDGFLQKEGIENVPIGVSFDSDYPPTSHFYQERLAGYAVKYKSNDDAEDAVRLYRRLLSNSEDKINIVEVGFHNVIGAVLSSEGDDISPMTGIELFKEKVEKVWVMGGAYDKFPGKEYNFCWYEKTRIGANILCDKCPVPITFLGFEVGVGVITGGDFLEEGDTLRDVLCDFWSKHNPPKPLQGRDSWDPMTSLLAIIGDEEKAGYDIVRGKNYVDPVTGENNFTEDENGLHAYVVKKYENKYYEDMINDIIRYYKIKVFR